MNTPGKTGLLGTNSIALEVGMPTFRVEVSRLFTVEVEASNQDDALTRALEIPFDDWDDADELSPGDDVFLLDEDGEIVGED